MTQCPDDGLEFSLLDSPAEIAIAIDGDRQIAAKMLRSDADGAEFVFRRAGRPVFRKHVDDLSNPNGWLGISEDRRSIAINSSNGGAAGGWSVSILRIADDGSVTDLSSLMKLVETDFSSPEP